MVNSTPALTSSLADGQSLVPHHTVVFGIHVGFPHNQKFTSLEVCCVIKAPTLLNRKQSFCLIMTSSNRERFPRYSALLSTFPVSVAVVADVCVCVCFLLLKHNCFSSSSWIFSWRLFVYHTPFQSSPHHQCDGSYVHPNLLDHQRYRMFQVYFEFEFKTL